MQATTPYTIDSSSTLFFLCALPFSLHGKCTTGTAKNELDGSRIPASILYHAMNAAIMPNTPPARVSPTLGCPSAVLGASRYAAPRKMKASHTIMNSELKASVDLRVISQRRKVKMNQAKICVDSLGQLCLCEF
jgi:hypothetical protein